MVKYIGIVINDWTMSNLAVIEYVRMYQQPPTDREDQAFVKIICSIVNCGLLVRFIDIKFSKCYALYVDIFKYEILSINADLYRIQHINHILNNTSISDKNKQKQIKCIISENISDDNNVLMYDNLPNKYKKHFNRATMEGIYIE